MAAVILSPRFGSSCRHGVAAEKVGVARERIADERVVRETLTYIGREMTSPQGGFYSATDADSKDAAGHNAPDNLFTSLLPAVPELIDEPAASPR